MYLKKSSLQKTSLSRTKHFSLRDSLQCAHLRHLECQLLSRTFRMNLSRIKSPHPVHLGMVAVKKPILRQRAIYKMAWIYPPGLCFARGATRGPRWFPHGPGPSRRLSWGDRAILSGQQQPRRRRQRRRPPGSLCDRSWVREVTEVGFSKMFYPCVKTVGGADPVKAVLFHRS